MKLWYSTLFPLWCAVQGSSEFAIVDPGLPEVRGHFEVSITVTIGSASHIFEAQDRNIGNAVQRFCNRVTEETRTLEACVTELEAAAQDVLKRKSRYRWTYIIGLVVRGGCCRWAPALKFFVNL